MIRELETKDKEFFISMVKEFYQTDGVLHDIPEEHIYRTYDKVISGSPFTDAFIIQKDADIAGYALVSYSFSNEAGGMVLWMEELFIRQGYRGLGLGGLLLDFIKKKYANRMKRIRLELTKSNTSAMELYVNKGFEVLEYQQMVLEY